MQRGMSGASRWLPCDDVDPLYDPFRRYDQYGTMGVTPQPWWEYLRLGLLAVTLLPLKFVGTLGARGCSTASAGVVLGDWHRRT